MKNLTFILSYLIIMSSIYGAQDPRNLSKLGFFLYISLDVSYSNFYEYELYI
jgi:hypothetical protein